MTLVASNLPLNELNRQYLALRRKIARRPSETYFQAPIDLVQQCNQLRVIIAARQLKKRKVVK